MRTRQRRSLPKEEKFSIRKEHDLCTYCKLNSLSFEPAMPAELIPVLDLHQSPVTIFRFYSPFHRPEKEGSSLWLPTLENEKSIKQRKYKKGKI
jgi:hypothetical protein